MFLRLPKDKMGVDERYRAVIENKTIKSKHILNEELKK